MNPVSNFLKEGVPLFSSIKLDEFNGLRSFTPVRPNKIKFLYEPDVNQVLFPGMYFVLPVELSVNEMEILDKAIVTIVSCPHADPLTRPLPVPLSLARKLSGKHDVPPLMNTFRFSHNRLFLKSANCVIAPPSKVPFADMSKDAWIDQFYFTLESTSAFLQAAIYLMCTSTAPRKDKHIRNIGEDLKLLCRNLDHQFAYVCDMVRDEITLSLGSLIFQDGTFDNESAQQYLLYSFFHHDTDVQQFFKWK